MATLPNPFMFEPDQTFALDADAFMAELEPAPAFLSEPRADYLRAIDIMPIVETLSDYLKPRRFAQG